MKFAHMEMLFLIWLAPALFLAVLWGARRRRKILDGFSAPKSLAVIAPGMSSGRRWVKSGLILAAILLAAFSLSGPQYGFRWQEVERRGIDIMIALDCSRSMLAVDVNPTRLDRAKREIIDLLNMLEGDRIGLVAFSGEAFLQCPLTLDYEAFHLFLNSLSPDSVPVGGTNLAAAIQTAMDGFEQTANTEKAILIITDGENTGDDPLGTMEKAVGAGIKIFCIGVGGTEGVPVPARTGGFQKGSDGKIVLSRLDEGLLKKLAAGTGGMYVGSVAGDMDLDVIYRREIRGKMDPATLTTNRKQVWEDRFQWPLLLALIALIAEMFLPAARRGGLPLLMVLLMGLAAPETLWAESVSESAARGQAAYESGDYDKALKQYIDAQLEEPEKPEIDYNLGNVYYKKGDYDEAFRHYQKALAAKDPALRQKIHYNLGNTAFRKKKFDQAVTNYEAALKLDPRDNQAAQNLEFVRKVMDQEQQRRESGSGESSSPPDEQEQETENSAKDKGNSDNKDESEASASPSPSEKPGAEQSGDGAENQSRGVGSKPGEEENQGKAGEPPPAVPGQPDQAGDPTREGQASGNPDGTMTEHQVERLLNRLQDLPGGAMTPQYGKREVERDW